MPISQIRVALVIAYAAICTHANAIDVGLIGSIESEYTTNSGQSASAEVEQWIQKPSVELMLRESSSALVLDAFYSIEHRVYDSLFDDETISIGQASVIWKPRADLFRLEIRNSRDEIAQDSRRAFIPSNKQVLTRTEVRPVLRLDSYGKQFVELSGVIASNRYSETQVDSDVQGIDLRYGFVSPNMELGFIGSHADIEFVNQPMDDFRTSKAGFYALRSSPKLTLDLELAYNNTQRVGSLSDVNGLVGQVEMEYSFSKSTSAKILVDRIIGDQSGQILIGAVDIAFTRDSEEPDISTEQRNAISLETQFDTNRFEITLFRSTVDFETLDRDKSTNGLEIQFTRLLSSRSSLVVSGSLIEEHFESRETGDVDRPYMSASYDRKIGKRSKVSFTVGHRKLQFESRTANETFGLLTFDYMFLDFPTGL